MMTRQLYLCLAAALVLTGCGDDTVSGGGGSDAVCGNGTIETGEACDDGNTASDDGCAADCGTVEDGYTCPETGGACTKDEEPPVDEDPVCGDGTVDDGEACDDGNTASDDGCAGDCSLVEDGYTCPETGGTCTKNEEQPRKPVCGNGVIEDGERCDDGNAESGDGCPADCSAVEDGYICEKAGYDCIKMGCGNGIVEEGELCDDGELNVEYSDNGMKLCSVSCAAAHYCGDGLLDQVDRDYGEQCDDGENNVESTSDKYNACTVRCRRINFCGDGKINGTEKCDDGNAKDGDGCAADCSALEPNFACSVADGRTVCTPIACGNGIIDADKGEKCDDGGRVSGDGCSSACQVEIGWDCSQTDETGRSLCTLTCGNGILEPASGEKCDDGNTESGDGCAPTCRVEAGYYCEQPEKADENGRKLSVCSARGCGDGYAAGTEECDDGNTKDGDGCSARCLREPGYHCPETGGKCEKDVCGDGKVTGDETCDEGTAEKTEGCKNCRIQMGWECLTPGAACTKTAVCGDGKLQGAEECDEGTAKTEGCRNCLIADGWRCPGGEGKSCVKGKCGDGTVDKGEQCDDGNKKAGDGCSPICEIEPIFECHGPTCRPTCGDGLTLLEAGEECDDGNLIAGDGCSPTCKIERGFTCTAPGAETKFPDHLSLPIIYRDFIKYNGNVKSKNMSPMADGYVSKELYDSMPDHCKGTKNGYRPAYPLEIGRPSPDFYSYCPASRCINAVKPVLGADGKPDLSEAGVIKADSSQTPGEACHHLYTCPEVFKWWYNDIPGINKRYNATITLDHLGDGRYRFNSGNFLPLNGLTDVEGGKGYTDAAGLGEFTSEFHTYFKYKGGETLHFRGDDDVWVFFNKRLGVDVGGIHPAWEKSITLTENKGKDLHMFPGGIYSLDMFHAERCLGGSSYMLELSGFIQMGRSTCTTTCGDGIIAGTEQCDIKGHTDDETAAKAGCVNCMFKSYCGNGKVETGEGCDTGETKTDWCSDCRIVTCGNNRVDAYEQCDTVDGKSVFAGKTEAESAGLVCEMCRIVGCGDGIKDEGEECDDGNTVNDDSCSNVCRLPVCGDGIVQSAFGEVCDDGVNDGTYGHCGLGCAYEAPRCGDGAVDALNGEICDDGINNGAYGGCNADCTKAPFCGDGIVQPEFESCDEGDQNGIGECSAYCSIAIN